LHLLGFLNYAEPYQEKHFLFFYPREEIFR